MPVHGGKLAARALKAAKVEVICPKFPFVGFEELADRVLGAGDVHIRVLDVSGGSEFFVGPSIARLKLFYAEDFSPAG